MELNSDNFSPVIDESVMMFVCKIFPRIISKQICCVIKYPILQRFPKFDPEQRNYKYTCNTGTNRKLCSHSILVKHLERSSKKAFVFWLILIAADTSWFICEQESFPAWKRKMSTTRAIFCSWHALLGGGGVGYSCPGPAWVRGEEGVALSWSSQRERGKGGTPVLVQTRRGGMLS